MVLYLVSLGLGDEKDITVRGLECVKKCSALYLEYYTSVLGIDKERLEQFYGVPVILADRNMVESEAETIYMRAKTEDIGFLVVGDALCATTHVDLMLRAKNLGIEVQVIHNTSVMGAVASCGLQLYQYGYTVSIPLFEGDWKPDSFYERIKYNKNGGMHTLCLLDIKVDQLPSLPCDYHDDVIAQVKEPDYNSMVQAGKVKFLPPRFMTVNVAIKQLLEVEALKQEGVVTSESYGVGMARLGQSTQKIVYGKLGELVKVNFGAPLHCMALCGEIHPVEQEILEYYRVKPEDYFAEGEEEQERVRGDDESDDSDVEAC